MNFDQSVYGIDEDKGLVQLILILNSPSTTNITVRVFSDDGSATGKRVSDYLFSYKLTTVLWLYTNILCSLKLIRSKSFLDFMFLEAPTKIYPED